MSGKLPTQSDAPAMIFPEVGAKQTLVDYSNQASRQHAFKGQGPVAQSFETGPMIYPGEGAPETLVYYSTPVQRQYHPGPTGPASMDTPPIGVDHIITTTGMVQPPAPQKVFSPEEAGIGASIETGQGRDFGHEFLVTTSEEHERRRQSTKGALETELHFHAPTEPGFMAVAEEWSGEHTEPEQHTPEQSLAEKFGISHEGDPGEGTSTMVVGGVQNGCLILGSVSGQRQTVEQLEAQLRDLGMTSDAPTFGLRNLVGEAMAQRDEPQASVFVGTKEEIHTTSKEYEEELALAPGEAPTRDAVLDHQAQVLENFILAEQKNAAAEQKKNEEGNITPPPSPQTQASTDEVSTDQQRESLEEGYIDEHGNVVVSKTVTRVVTTTKSVVEGDKPTEELTKQIVETTETPSHTSSSGQSAGASGGQPLIRLKVNDQVFGGVMDGQRHIHLYPIETLERQE